MNAALLLLGAAIVVPFAGFEARRKWRDWCRAQQPFRGTPLREDTPPSDLMPAPMLAPRISTPSPTDVRDGVWHHPSGATYWVGLDLASGDDLCSGHGNDTYAADDQSSCGTIGGLSE